MNKLMFIPVSLLFVFSCDSSTEKKGQNVGAVSMPMDAPQLLHRSVTALHEVIINDIFVPPVSSRIYAYTMLASYEALRYKYPNYQSITTQLNGFEPMPTPQIAAKYNFVVASIKAFFTVAKGLVHSPKALETTENRLYEDLKSQIPAEVFQRSLDFGIEVAEVIKKRIAKDNYKETRGMARYTPLTSEVNWQPTAPAYMDAVEPYWNKIMPLALENPAQFKPKSPFPFNLDKKSPFYKETIEVYETIKNLTETQKTIATFWDNNPFIMVFEGHLEYAVKKISPGGHWLQITALATQNAGADLIQTAESYALVSISLLDGFISCWDEKYRSNYVRPQTVIEKYIDNQWLPFIQTPPFPEYTSGHSVISNAAAAVLTQLYGENFAFVDSTQVQYDLKPRPFKSFYEASAEASISRLYGGIHFRNALEKGNEQGREVGGWVMQRVKAKKK